MHLVGRDAKDLPRSAGDPGKQFRRVMGVQPIGKCPEMWFLHTFGESNAAELRIHFQKSL
jgi:hypothetical protein